VINTIGFKVNEIREAGLHINNYSSEISFVGGESLTHDTMVE
jgi:hypothetical protein